MRPLLLIAHNSTDELPNRIEVFRMEGKNYDIPVHLGTVFCDQISTLNKVGIGKIELEQFMCVVQNFHLFFANIQKIKQ